MQKLYKHRSKSAIAITKINEKSISSSETGMQIKELSRHILPKNKLTITILKTVCGLTHIFWQDALSPTTARFIQKQWHWRVSVSPVKLEERCSADHHESMDRIHSTTAAVLDKCSLTIEAMLQKRSVRGSPLIYVHLKPNRNKSISRTRLSGHLWQSRISDFIRISVWYLETITEDSSLLNLP